MKLLTRSFAGGVITPEMYGRIDLDKFQTGLAEAENFIVLPHGPVQNRPGTVFVKEVKDSEKAVVLIPFFFNSEQSYVLEMGDGYFRVHTEGQTLLAGSPGAWSGATAYVIGDLVSSAGANYYCILGHTNQVPPNATYWYAMPADGTFEVPTPFAEADLFDLHTVQSADVLTIVHPGYAPREIRRYGATDWVVSTIAFDPLQAAPTGVTAVATVGSGSISYQYVVTALAAADLEESYSSTASSAITNNLATAGNYNTISWTGASGATRYNVYKLSNGLYGYIGQASGTSFKDDNITADVTRTPPEANNPFTGAGKYPAAVGYFEGRRWFGGSTDAPQSLWSTRSGTESNMSRSIPVRDDDAITARILSRAASVIRHILPLSELLLLTSEAEWRVTASNSDILTPTSVGIKATGYTGASNVQPVVTYSSVIYAHDRGGRLQEMRYSWEQQGYEGQDISVMAPHLFDGHRVVQMAFTRAPSTIVWCVRDDGVLLAVTYMPQHKVFAWHVHNTDGEIESVAAAINGDEETLYLVVKRKIDGSDVRYVEYLHSRQFSSLDDAFFVDCGGTYDGAPATTISGLDHLEGEEVSALADGVAYTGLTVSSGEITLPEAASVVHVGLPYTSTLRTLPVSMEAEAYGQGIQKNVNSVTLRVHEALGMSAGPSLDQMTQYPQRSTEDYGDPTALFSGIMEVVIIPNWDEEGQVYVQQALPLPVTISSQVLDVATGG